MSRIHIRIGSYVYTVLSSLYPHSGHVIFRIRLQRECHSISEGSRLSDHLSYSEYHLLQDFRAVLDYQSYLHLLEELSSPVYNRADIVKAETGQGDPSVNGTTGDNARRQLNEKLIKKIKENAKKKKLANDNEGNQIKQRKMAYYFN